MNPAVLLGAAYIVQWYDETTPSVVYPPDDLPQSTQQQLPVLSSSLPGLLLESLWT